MTDNEKFSLDDIIDKYSGKPKNGGERPDISFSEPSGSNNSSVSDRVRKFEVHIPEDGELPPVPETDSDASADSYAAEQDSGYNDDEQSYSGDADEAYEAEQYFVMEDYDDPDLPYEPNEAFEADEPYENSEPVVESADGYEEPAEVEEYRSDENNKGGGFTMRTSDDPDPKKIKSNQREYQRRGEEELIGGQIARLRSQLTVRAAVLLFTSVFGLFIAIANDLGLTLAPVFDRAVNPSAYTFTNTLLGIISVGFSYSMVTMGFKSLLKGAPDSDTLVSINILAAIISGMATLFDPETLKMSYFHIYTPAAITLLLFNTLGKLSVIRRAERNFEFVSKTQSFAAVQQVSLGQGEASYKVNGDAAAAKELAYLKETDFVKDFMKNSYSSDLSDLFARKTALSLLLVAAAVGVLSFATDHGASAMKDKLFVMLAAISGTLSMCSSFSLTLAANRPLARASKRALEHSGVLLGYSSVEEHADVNSVLTDASALFPTGCVQFAHLKMLGKIPIDRAMIYAASLAYAGGSVTCPAFYKMLRGDESLLIPVTGCTADNSGISGTAEQKRMLLGSREMMERRGIAGLPSQDAESTFADGYGVMYLAVSGSAVMMFAVGLLAERSAAKWIRELEAEKVRLHVTSADGFVTRELIARLYGLRPVSVKLLPPYTDATESLIEPVESLSASMFCTGHISAFALLLVAAKRVRHAANIGVAVQYGSMLLGIAVSVVMMVLGAFSQITPTLVVLYNLVFLLLTEFLQSRKQI